MNEQKQKRMIMRSIYSDEKKKSLKSIIMRELVLNFGYSDKIKIAEALSDTILQIFEDYSRDRDKVEPRECLWLGIDENDAPAHGKTIQLTKQKIAKFALWRDDEINALADGKKRFGEVERERIIRIAKESALQGVLLNPTDISLIVGREVTGVRRIIREYEKETNTSVPIRSRIHEIGSHQTHKGIIIKMHLNGMFTSEIARLTGHDPENVDRYIEGFNRVLELHEKNLAIEKISFITGISLKVVKQYLEIIKENNLKSSEDSSKEGFK